VEILYNITFYNKNDILIKPSELSLFNKINIFCLIEIVENKNSTNKTIIISLANIYKNKQFYCKEFLNIKEKVKFGIKIDIEKKGSMEQIFSSSSGFIFDIIHLDSNRFSPFLINKEFLEFQKECNLTRENKSLKLKKIYAVKPIYENKKFISSGDNIWYFKNIYNNYFCFCKGLCKYENNYKKCKYYFYLDIINNNKNLYNKTDYLLSDFYLSRCSSDDTFPIFVEMIKRNMSAHYMDEKNDIYEKFCGNDKYCLKVIKLVNGNYFIDGNFLEKYLDIILRLKAVIAGESFYSFNNIFYDIDYITYINVGHGVKFFKRSSYIYYGTHKRYNKLMLPPSDKIISIAKQYGWTDNNIIKNCLPRWDKYNTYKQQLLFENLRRNNSIFVMFTFRNVTNHSYNMNTFYLKNILKLINNIILNKELKKEKITLYFTLHSLFRKYKNKIMINNKNTKYVKHRDVSKCLMETNLLVSDFSSIIFDMIYQSKPYIMFIPDAQDPNIKYVYDTGYYEIIESLKNGTIYFENRFLILSEAINKILYYIKNNFKLELKVEKFYESFQFNCRNNTESFINYLNKTILL
jgi:CDP-glycerol glycerophosphotransferase (TagB/SpsB family)